MREVFNKAAYKNWQRCQQQPKTKQSVIWVVSFRECHTTRNSHKYANAAKP